jgi:periplasmic protein TonB
MWAWSQPELVLDVNDKRKHLLMGVGIFLAVALLGGAMYYMLSGKSSSGVKRPPKITLMPTTPPPPPPKEEKKPEPPKEQKEIKDVPQAPPKDAPPAPPSQDLKMDGPAGDGPSAFSSGKITNEDLSKVGTGGGSGGIEPPKGLFNPFNNYSTQIKGELQRYLNKNKDLKQQAYKIKVDVWVNASGAVFKHKLLGSTGDADMDEAINQAIKQMEAFSSPPPDNMPMPINLRLVTGGR